MVYTVLLKVVTWDTEEEAAGTGKADTFRIERIMGTGVERRLGFFWDIEKDWTWDREKARTRDIKKVKTWERAGTQAWDNGRDLGYREGWVQD